ncbi:PLP-dependent aminotransferase family protein [Bradyrhizobium tropiciagri]|uniref:aminotransferase-like domain-containing protein n=1 Tax=Bradyrhizobium tropiciagri TaxID=312253 RepID=UPI001BA84956|nr:PLP-dependent aminotransferase family protein [Bradyrhizobium tropiciagri]MBR0896770.1 PLP-dependent aminotransferase family protein [Bradyrhizobium tropiciagri]
MKRYQEVVRIVHQRIESGALALGQKLPSVRAMSEQSGYSIVTVHHAYALLESEGVIEAKPRSGFYVARSPRPFADSPLRTRAVHSAATPVTVPALTYAVMSSWHAGGGAAFGALYPSQDLYPHAEINKHLCRVLRQGTRANSITLSGLAPEGDSMLREAIAKRAALRHVFVDADDVLVTQGAMHGMNLCLDALTQPGDLVLVESPTFFPLLAALQRRHLVAVEIQSHPRGGIDPDHFDHLIKRHSVKACVLMPVNHYPTGVTYPDDVMRRVVASATRARIPIIENDAFSELTYTGNAAASLKKYDTSDLVFQLGSFSMSLAPGYGIGWIVNASHRAVLAEQKFFGNLFSGGLAQRAVAEYLLANNYDRHLRRLRETLTTRMRQGLALVSQRLPGHCAISNPGGGYMCWLRGPKEFDSLAASHSALSAGISILPGPIFSATNSFHNFIGLNLSVEWSEENAEKIGKVIDLITGGPRCRKN